jgi:hypothetical protein
MRIEIFTKVGAFLSGVLLLIHSKEYDDEPQ